MTWMPFISLGIGLLIGLRNLSERMLKGIDMVINVALIVLMLTIGIHIGINESVMTNLDRIGLNCVVISLSAILCSVVLTVVAEKTVLPLEKLKEKLFSENINLNDEVNVAAEEEKKTSPLIFIMPISIIAGIILGYFFVPGTFTKALGYLLIGSLVILYVSVGISLGSNKKVFRYIKVLGFRVVYLSIAILLGSMFGGWIAGMLLGLPPQVSVMSASGMSYYSLTGAYMTQVYGIETGTYGFIVNVMREFFTVLLLPLLIKVSKGSPIASGAAGDMDTMLVPVTKFVGIELGLVALITGTILTFAVPFLLPLLYHIFS